MNSEKEKKSKENETLTLVPQIGLIPKEEGKRGRRGRNQSRGRTVNPSISILNQTKENTDRVQPNPNPRSPFRVNE